MAKLKNELTWSFSRMRTFDSCRRRYYYQYYLKWGGWEADADSERRLAYRLSKMTTLPMFAGEIVHESISGILKRFRTNQINMTLSEVLESARVKWEKALLESKSEKYRADPKNFTCFLEDYYGLPARDRKITDSWDRIGTCIKNFLDSKVWSDLQRSRPTKWLAIDMEPFKASLIDGIPVHAKPDLGYDGSRPESPKSSCWVFDWKTGKPNERDILQVRYYALFAESEWLFPAESVKARLVYLFPLYQESVVEINLDMLKDARAVMQASFRDMASVITSIEHNEPLDLSHFPVTSRPELCRNCSYQEICSDRPSESVTAVHELDTSADDFDPFM